MADSTTDASASETPSGETSATGNVTFAPEQQKEIDRLIKAAQDASKEAGKYRTELKAIKEAELTAKGQVTELNAALQKERDELTTKIAALEASEKDKSEKLTAIETARKTELLSKLPAEKRAAYEGFDLTVLEQITKDFAGAAPSGNSQGNERGAAGASNGAFQVLSPEAALELKRTNPAAYHKYLEEFLKK